jgi:translocation and assembly module TamB
MTPAAQPKSKWRLRTHALAAAGSALLLGAAIFAGLFAYLNSAAFSRRMRQAVITTLERATGGRVEIGRFQWSLLHLHVQADDVTIHGLEPAGQRPYFHADAIGIDATLLSVLTPRIGLKRLRIERPVLHLIVKPAKARGQQHARAAGAVAIEFEHPADAD